MQRRRLRFDNLERSRNVPEGQFSWGLKSMAGASSAAEEVMNARRLMCSPQAEDHTLPHRCASNCGSGIARMSGSAAPPTTVPLQRRSRLPCAILRLTISAAHDRLLRHTNARTRTGTTSRHQSVSQSLPRHKRPPVARQEQQLHLPPKPMQRYPSPARISPPGMTNASGLRRADGAEMSGPSSRE